MDLSQASAKRKSCWRPSQGEMNSAPSLRMPMARTCSATPSCSNNGKFAGSSDSPIWKRGWRSFSSRVTWWPRRASSVATVEPAGPPPITSTSVCRSAASPVDAAASGDPPSIMGWILAVPPGNVVMNEVRRARSSLRGADQPLFDEACQRTDSRVIEDVGDIDQARPRSLDAFMDCDQFERTGADDEQTLIDVDVAAVELLLTDGAQLLRDFAAVDARRGFMDAQPLQFGELGTEGAVEILLFEHMALKLAAGGLGDAPHRHYGADLEARVLTDAGRDLARERQERSHVGAMQYKEQQLVGLGADRSQAGDHDLAQLETGYLLGDALQVVWIVILAIDEQDLLVAAGDIQLALMDQPQVSGSQPAVGAKTGGVHRRILVIAASDIGAADV